MIPASGRLVERQGACIIGDFDFKNIDWNMMMGEREAQIFPDVIEDNFLNS